MTEFELKLSLPDQLAKRARAAQGFMALGKQLREPGGPEITQAELESELESVRAELREARARRP